MKAKNYIVSEIKSFVQNFPQTRVRYEHDNVAHTHFIEIVPNNIYHWDNHYIQWESDFFDDFISQYPDENICFISDDAVVGLDKIDFELHGTEFFVNHFEKKEGNMQFDPIKALLRQAKKKRIHSQKVVH